jgi:hypothetical protein
MPRLSRLPWLFSLGLIACPVATGADNVDRNSTGQTPAEIPDMDQSPAQPATEDDAQKTSATSAAPAAIVLGETIRSGDASEVQEIILTRLLERYAEQQGVDASEVEVDAFIDTMQRGMRAEGLTAEDELTPDQAAQAREMRRDMGRAMIRQWKINRSLYGQYGGRIIFQQLGPEPLDAYRQFLEERLKAGDFKIIDESINRSFWRYFTDESLHSFYETGSEAESRAFAMPPWERGGG